MHASAFLLPTCRSARRVLYHKKTITLFCTPSPSKKGRFAPPCFFYQNMRSHTKMRVPLLWGSLSFVAEWMRIPRSIAQRGIGLALRDLGGIESHSLRQISTLILIELAWFCFLSTNPCAIRLCKFFQNNKAA